MTFVMSKFEENLIFGCKNDMRNLVNFNASTGKSENLQFDVLLLSIANKVSAKKVQKNYLSQHWKMIRTLKKKRTFSLKNEMRNLVNFNANSGISENLHFDGLILSKVFSVWAKKNTEEFCREKWLMVSKMTQGVWWIFGQVVVSNVR